MAYSKDSATSTDDESCCESTTLPILNKNYLCFWDESCNGKHELNGCKYWKERRGEMGTYYSPTGLCKTFLNHEIDGDTLESNRTGCTTVHLLVFNDTEKKILFGLKLHKESPGRCDDHRLSLSFPSAKLFRRNGFIFQVAYRAFKWLTTDTNFSNECLEQGLQSRIFFQNANIIFPVILTNEQSEKLTENFCQNDEFQSLHWHPLTEILRVLKKPSYYIKRKQRDNVHTQSSQINCDDISLGGHQLWFLTRINLLGIKKHVPGGFDEFLSR